MAATARLQDLAIVSYRVDPDRVRQHLPEFLTPERFEDDTESGFSLISAVSFRISDFRTAWLPVVRFAGVQVNYRAYARRDGEPCVWFFGTALSARWANLIRRLWKLPWYRTMLELTTDWIQGECRRYDLHASGDWASADLVLGPIEGAPRSPLEVRRLTEAQIGYCRRSDGNLARYQVFHEPMAPTPMSVLRAQYGLFERLGLIRPGDQPCSALLQRESLFQIGLPATLTVGGQ